MKILQRVSIAASGLTIMAGMASDNPARAKTDALLDCMTNLSAAVDKLGTPQSGEVSSERNEIKSAFDRLRPEVLDNRRQREDLEYEKEKFDRIYRENQDKLRQIDFKQEVLGKEWEILGQKFERIMEEAQRHAAAKAATDPEDEGAVATINTWAADGRTRMDGLTREKQALQARADEIEAERAAIAENIQQQAQLLATRYKFRFIVDQEMTSMIRECSALNMRATALKQIVNSVGGRSAYEAPDALAKKVMKDFAENLAKEGTNVAIRSKSGQQLIKNATRQIMKSPTVQRYLVRFGVTVEVLPVAFALTAADISADAALAGANQREREVVKNIYLIGEYAHAMERLFKLKGKDAKQTQEFEALVSEIKRLQADMPTGSWDFFTESIQNSAFLGNAFLGIASSYVSDKAGFSSAKTTKYLNNKTKKYLGPGGKIFFEEGQNVISESATDTFIKTSAQLAAEAYSIHMQTPKPPPVIIQMNPPMEDGGTQSLFAPQQ